MYHLLRNPTIRRLFLAQALFWSCAMLCVLAATLVGLELAPVAELASLPLALYVLGNLVALQPLARIMQRQDRRAGFLIGACAGLVGGVGSSAALWLDSFLLFCLGAIPIGAYQASAMYYRFAALEAVEDVFKGRAAAAVIGAGVVAAVLAPPLASLGHDLLTVPFSGIYLLLAAMAAVAALTLSTLPRSQPQGGQPASGTSTSWGALLTRPVILTAILTTAAGHGLMTLVMNATPLAMHAEGMDLSASGNVIQWHMLGMFLPAFAAGSLVDRYGARAIACLGVLLLAASALTAFHGLSQLHFIGSSFLLGAGWNLMLVAGTTQLAAEHGPHERASAQGLMELTNGGIAALMSVSSGALIAYAGWAGVNTLLLPVLIIVFVAQIAGLLRQETR
ncbi:MFS transporter [Pseudomonas asiatica]|uniref:MFS transporter n=1 Tax=Pseudomonas asiatica TaxID=2219225 RepID=UPI003877E6A1